MAGPRAGSRPGSLIRALLALALVWSCLVAAANLQRAWRGRPQDPGLAPSLWLLGGPQSEALRAELAAVAARAPRGATLALTSFHVPSHELHFVHLWTAFLLPHHRVVRDDASAGADYLLAWPALEPGLDAGPTTVAGGAGVELAGAVHRSPALSLHRLASSAPPPADGADEGPAISRAARADAPRLDPVHRRLDAGRWLSWALFVLATTMTGAAAVHLPRRLARRRGDAPADEPATGEPAVWGLWLFSGIVTLFVLLAWSDLIGLRWSPAALQAALAVGAALGVVALVRSRRGPGPGRGPRASGIAGGELGIAHLAATLGALAFAALTWRLDATLSDFVYHWGLKAKRLALTGGVDFGFLADPAAQYVHPDYPNLLPALWAAEAIATGSLHERMALLWSPVALAALLAVAVRASIGGRGEWPGRSSRQLGAALTVTTSAGFACGYYQAGSPDLFLAAGVLLIACALCSPWSGQPTPGGDGLAANGTLFALGAGLAAGAKIEGVVFVILASAVLAIDGARCVLRGRAVTAVAGSALPVLTPALLVALPWLLGVLRHDLFQPGNTAGLDPTRLPVVLAATWRAAWIPAWAGLPLLAVAGLAVALSRRSTRPVAALLLAQLGFYLYAYLATPFDVEALVATSFPRLLYHLVPAALVVTTIALVPDSEPDPGR
ncbi:MAG: hypothetical protein DWQ36_04375 [Acidobacteria bacterium]|nr:MAG: hypothetical protein DWQ30_22135 [Acidobacteriota bacterium]REK10397.1 MAG: hypothetical protein DWQ36_04375 [Acidobacteriota bacterium]